MGRSAREREDRACEGCHTVVNTLFRIRSSIDEPWVFLCQACQGTLKASSSTYVYGGTWKKKKRN